MHDVEKMLLEAGPEAAGLFEQWLTLQYMEMAVEAAAVAGLLTLFWFGGKAMIKSLGDS